ncbi:MAG: TetR/AcrR family transcriptional regulator [Hyphomicrobiaceae bacterium]
MQCFWHHGYATSVDVVIKEAGVSRHSLYGDFGGKDGLFKACLRHYSAVVVTPAFAQVEAKNARLTDVAAYFETQIDRGTEMGLPGPGCLMANTQTDVGTRESSIGAIVRAHNRRLAKGFRKGMQNEATAAGLTPSPTRVARLSELLVIFTNGLWCHSRTVADPALLRAAAKDILEFIEESLRT